MLYYMYEKKKSFRLTPNPENKMIKSETSWLNNYCECDSCGDTYKIGYLIPSADGDDICEDCFDVIELADD